MHYESNDLLQWFTITIYLYLFATIICASLSITRFCIGIKHAEMQKLLRFDGVIIFKPEKFLFMRFAFWFNLICCTDGFIGLYAIHQTHKVALQVFCCIIIGRFVLILLVTLCSCIYDCEYTLLICLDYCCQGLICMGMLNTILLLEVLLVIFIQFLWIIFSVHVAKCFEAVV